MKLESTWTLIYVGNDCTGPQLLIAHGFADAQAAAMALDAEHPWLSDYALVAAVQGAPKVRLMDDARTAERGLLDSY